jgi:hypothetical protein
MAAPPTRSPQPRTKSSRSVTGSSNLAAPEPSRTSGSSRSAPPSRHSISLEILNVSGFKHNFGDSQHFSLSLIVKGIGHKRKSGHTNPVPATPTSEPDFHGFKFVVDFSTGEDLYLEFTIQSRKSASSSDAAVGILIIPLLTLIYEPDQTNWFSVVCAKRPDPDSPPARVRFQISAPTLAMVSKQSPIADFKALVKQNSFSSSVLFGNNEEKDSQLLDFLDKHEKVELILPGVVNFLLP